MAQWKLGVYGHPVDETREDTMDYYFVVLTEGESEGIIECVVQRNKNQIPAPVAGKKFVKTDGVRLTFYYRLFEQSSNVSLAQVLNYGS